MDRASVATRFKDVLYREFLVDRSRISDTATFEELGLDSMDLLKLEEALEDEFQLPQSANQMEEFTKIRSVGRAIDAIVEKTR